MASSSLQPSVSKACSRCHPRKVKCDLRVPRCSACIRLGDECNITERVYYPYSVVRELQDQVNELRARLSTGQGAPGSVNHDQSQGGQQTSSAIDGHAGARPQGGTGANLTDIQKEAEEVGVLAIGGSDIYTGSKYVGSAAGSTFARIFFKQLNLVPSWVTGRQGGSLEQCPSARQAALPPPPIARSLLVTYISRIHAWWPFMHLPHLRRTCQRIYDDPRQCSDQEKFVIFIVFALAASEPMDAASGMRDLNDPEAYFQTSLRFFNHFHDHPRDLFGIQAVLLLTLWMLNSASNSHNNDLWHLSRYVMSAAIEAGLHRHNTDWGFAAEELEIRNRTWWCAFNLERQVATTTGRVLSIRDHAIHALLPRPASFDALGPRESLAAPIFHKHNIAPFRHMIALRRLGGRILESIYIARGPDGKAMDTSFQDICTASDQVRRELEQWKHQLDEMDIKPSREYSEMKIEYCLLQLLLHRPSPTFMVPSRQMISHCSKAVSSSVHQWSKISNESGAAAVCRCFRQLHDILLVALAGLYCDWQASAAHNSRGSSSMVQKWHRHLGDVDMCLNWVLHGIAYMKAPYLARFRDLLLALRQKVYAEVLLSEASPNEMASQRSVMSSGGMFDTDAGLGFEDMVYSTNDNLEAYMSQVNEVLDGSLFDVDEAINAWYDSLMEEVQGSNRTEPAY
ncbi:hypothetical protein VTK73DRAFT_803 [Phialemonium thermophilum]|uniref:Zn(2)-C6 fungal-type domain-containing protein n=1 Tax=Phialemonium thermophilum TaxID=223376 RepID=A0ABR3XCI0_9PEZI